MIFGDMIGKYSISHVFALLTKLVKRLYKNGVGVTVVSHDSESRILVDGYDNDE